MIRILAVLLLFATVSCKLDAEGEPDVITECKIMTPKKIWNACITKTAGSENKDVLFFLHGATGSHKHWVQKYKGVRDVWRAKGFQPPVVVTFNFGPTWFMAEKNKSPFSGLFQFYLESLIPWAEKQIGHKAERKLLLGESMGGFNAAQFYFKRPDVFSKVAIVCPAFTSWGPQSPKEEVEEYVRRTNANEGHIKWLRAGWKAFFPNEEAWSNADVYQLVEKYRENLPPLFLSCGTEDDFGFYEGSLKMAEILTSRNANMIWNPLPGAHCARPFEEIAEFFMSEESTIQ